MLSNHSDATKLAQMCLLRCGFIRNLQPILEALEEQIYGNGGALNSEDFEENHDYRNVRYGGVKSTSLIILKEGSINRNIDCKFSQVEIDWLTALAVEGKFGVKTLRKDFAVHDINLVLDVPISPTNFDAEKVRMFIELNGTAWQAKDVSICAKVQSDDEEKLSKALTLYLLS